MFLPKPLLYINGFLLSMEGKTLNVRNVFIICLLFLSLLISALPPDAGDGEGERFSGVDVMEQPWDLVPYSRGENETGGNDTGVIYNGTDGNDTGSTDNGSGEDVAEPVAEKELEDDDEDGEGKVDGGGQKEAGYSGDDDTYGNGARDTNDDSEAPGEAADSDGAEGKRGVGDMGQDLIDALDSQYVYIGVAILLVCLLILAGVVTRRHRQRKKVLKGLRRDIYEYLKHNPGEHLAAIMYEFDMSPSSTTYHLNVLEKNEEVLSHKKGKYKRYYAKEDGVYGGSELRNWIGGLEYKEIVSVLKNDTTSEIVRYVMEHPGCSQKDIAGALDLAPSTVNWHMKKLRGADIVDLEKTGRYNNYTISDEEVIAGTMNTLKRDIT